MTRLTRVVTALIVLTSALSTAYADECLPVWDFSLCTSAYNKCHSEPLRVVETEETRHTVGISDRKREAMCNLVEDCGDPIPGECQITKVKAVEIEEEEPNEPCTYEKLKTIDQHDNPREYMECYESIPRGGVVELKPVQSP